MPDIKPSIRLLIIFFIILFCFLPALTAGAEDSAKQRYLSADSCYKKLRHSASKKEKATEWLACIKKYETIYRMYPDSSWAPAGMYKAAGLYVTLARLSGKNSYKNQAADLLIRIKNRYPRSAYSGRAGALLAKIGPAEKKEKGRTESRHIKSKKEETKNTALIENFNTDSETAQSRPSLPEKPDTLPGANDQAPIAPIIADHRTTEDTTITDLRFWSNPEYTRIVVNAADEREYSHRLLKKDPDINKLFQRLYIDIEQSRLGQNVAEHTPINDHLLNQARAGQFLPHTVRVVVDIKSFENYKIFSLKDPFRIVIDIWGKGSSGSPAKSSQTLVANAGGSKTIKQYSTDNLKSSDIARQLALGVKKIVIDPGHGGSDPGAPGYYKGVWEKDIVLKIAKKLAVILRDELKCTVVLTRSKDKTLTLEERTAFANTERADLFISLHCNAAKNRRLAGIETYLLNLATDEKAIAVAARENATSEKNISDLEYILSDLMKHAKIEESTRLAKVVHQSFVNGMKKRYSKINNLGVKRAPFYVLLGASMPSILIETSFVSNKKECKRLMSDAYQTNISKSIAAGVEKYIEATNPRRL